MATSMTVSISNPIGNPVAGIFRNTGPTITTSFNFLLDSEDEAREYGHEAARYFESFMVGFGEGCGGGSS